MSNMSNLRLTRRLEDYLREHGFSYHIFCQDGTDYYFQNSLPYGKYVSLNLRIITGIEGDMIRDDDKHLYDIDLINRITKCLIDSKDEELKSVAWNSFSDCDEDERFILSKERKKAKVYYFKELVNCYCTNHTKMLESKRLLIKPNNKEYGMAMHDYIKRWDKENLDFARLASNPESTNRFVFSLCLKETDEVIGNIGFFFDRDSEDTFEVSYYIKKGYRRKGYIKEGFQPILQAIQNNEIVLYGNWRREYVREERKPVIKLLRIKLDEDNVASFHTAESLGFEYEGKVVRYERTQKEGSYKSEHHFIKRIP